MIPRKVLSLHLEEYHAHGVLFAAEHSDLLQKSVFYLRICVEVSAQVQVHLFVASTWAIHRWLIVDRWPLTRL